MNTIIGCIILIYILFVFPCTIGAYFITNKYKKIEDIYVFGMLLFMPGCLFVCFICSFLKVSLSMTSKIIAIIISVTSIWGFLNFYKKRKEIEFQKKSILGCVILILIVLCIMLFRIDDARDMCLKIALSFIQNNSFETYSVYSGLKMNESTSLYGMAGFYAILSQLSTIHVMIIGKWVMPISASFLLYSIILNLKNKFQEKKYVNFFIASIVLLDSCFLLCPWGEIFWCLHLLLLGLIYYIIEVDRTLKSFVIYITSVAGIVLCVPYYFYGEISMLFYAITNEGKVRHGNLGYYISCFLFCVLLYLLIFVVAKLSKKTKNIKTYAVTFLFISYVVFCNIYYGFSYNFSEFEMVDNRYKINDEVMQIREMVDGFAIVKMLAPIEVTEQIRNMDSKVQLLYGSYIFKNPNMENDLRIYETALELQRDPYDLTKIIKNGLKFACNIIVVHKESADTEFASEYGYQLLGETGKYKIYEFIGE